MKKLTIAMIAVLLALALFGCGSDAGLAEDEDITMATIDDYLDADARFVDLRNFSDQLNGGYVAGFEVVPFFEYLEGRALVRNNGWEFSAADVVSASTLENIFGDKEGAVVLMCGSGTRAGYVKAALEDIGYTKVFNAGGIRDYSGENKILGDGEFNGEKALAANITMENIDNWLGRPGAKYVDLRNVSDKYTGGYIDGFELVSFFEYLEGNALVRNNGWEFSAADIESAAVLENIFGGKSREVFLMCGSGTRAGYVKVALEEVGYETVINVGGIRDYAGENKVLGDPETVLALR